MVPTNLSEKLFKPRFKYPETSTLIPRKNHHNSPAIHAALEGGAGSGWYRTLNRLIWRWRGLNSIEIEEVLSRIAISQAEHSDPLLLDTVIGYRNGNWIYEWSAQGMLWQQKAQQQSDAEKANEYWLNAANFYSIASYPHLKGDMLAEQAEALANKAFEQSAQHAAYPLKQFSLPVAGSKPLIGFVHLPNQGQAPFPTVLICGGLDSLQNDYHRLFRCYLAPLGLAMMTIDMPSIGFSSHAKLRQDTSALHQILLNQLDKLPWVDAARIGLFGVRFGGNVAVRLAYLEPRKLQAVACLGPIVHSLLTDVSCQQQVPDMWIDVLASRLGMADSSDAALKTELNRYSLKTQGLLGRRTLTPMLSAYWERDPFSPKEESKLIADPSADGRVLAIPSEPLLNSFDRALKEICGWLQEKLA